MPTRTVRSCLLRPTGPLRATVGGPAERVGPDDTREQGNDRDRIIPLLRVLEPDGRDQHYADEQHR
jgi:hypothetical protein